MVSVDVKPNVSVLQGYMGGWVGQWGKDSMNCTPETGGISIQRLERRGGMSGGWEAEMEGSWGGGGR